MATLKNPEIKKSFVCSTTHISTDDDKILMTLVDNPLIAESDFIIILGNDFGYRIIISCDTKKLFAMNLDILLTQLFLKEGLSQEFCNLIKVANALDCSELVIDCDGLVYDDLPKFDW